MNRPLYTAIAATALLLSACAPALRTSSAVDPLPTSQDQFWASLRSLCERAAAGRLLQAPAGDTQIDPAAALVVHFRECGRDELRFPLHVDANRSRTWVFIRHEGHLELRHDHRRADGTEDTNTWYGAATLEGGTATRQEFVTERNGVRSGWRVEIEPGRRFTYGTIRDGAWRHHLEFDLTRPAPVPPPPWGHDVRPSQRPGQIRTQLAPAAEFAAIQEELREFRRIDRSLPLPGGVDPRYSDRLGSVSIAAFEEERRVLERLLARLSALDRAALDRSTAIDAQILEQQLASRAAELAHRGYLLPLGSRSGFHFSFAGTPLTGRFDTVRDYDRYIGRMQSFLEHTRQQIALLREGIRTGIVMPRAVLDGYDATAGDHVTTSAEQSAFHAPLERIPPAVAAADRERILRDGRAAIEQSVLPAFRELRDFLRDEYVPAARPTLGVTDLPDGASYYAHRVRMYTTLDLTAADVHAIGQREVAAIRAEMDRIRERVGFSGTHLEFIQWLRDDPRFTARTEGEYLALVAWAAKLMDGELPRLFRVLPRTPYGVRPMPAHIAPRQSAGYYDRGTPGGTQAGWVNINTSLLHTRPTWVTRALAFHEGVPGHHLQIMLTQENDAISDLRRGGGVTAFVEGWGLYAERLGLDVGLYDDPFDLFGMWSYQIWRACRLVVDTGMHALGWDRQRAIDFMAENTGMAPEAVAAEIDRHITEPGQGLAYSIGSLEIGALRAAAESALGDRFDIREFHDVVLRNGPLPLLILRQEVERWIEERRTRS
jgi:uncharacterized protein (DUF885 family)